MDERFSCLKFFQKLYQMQGQKYSFSARNTEEFYQWKEWSRKITLLGDKGTCYADVDREALADMVQKPGPL